MLEEFVVVIAGGLAVLPCLQQDIVYEEYSTQSYESGRLSGGTDMGFGGHQRTLRKHFSTPLDGVDEAPSLPQLRVYDLGLHRAQMRRKSEGLTFFSYLNLSRGFLAPKLTDYLIGNEIERLLERGELVQLSRPKIGGSYSCIGGRPAPA